MSKYNFDGSQEKRQGIMSLVLAVYRVTDKVPQHEPLRTKLREECLNVVSTTERFIYDGSHENLFHVHINSLIQLLHIAQQQNLGINNINFVILKRELYRLRQETENTEISKKQEDIERGDVGVVMKEKLPQKQVRPRHSKDSGLSARQKGLFTYLQKHNTAQIKDLQNVLPKVSGRTIRRDLDKMAKNGWVRRSGKTNGTSYTLIRTNA